MTHADADSTSAFADFWAASSLTALNRGRFLDGIARFDPLPPPVHPWARAGQPTPLAAADGPLADLAAARRSRRRFAADPLPGHLLDRLLGSLAERDGHRAYAAGGGLHTCGVSVLLLNVDHPLNGQIAQHDARRHVLTRVGPCPSWPELTDDLAGQDAQTAPAAVLAVFADPTLMLEKYGERGGRFLLLEAGALLHHLGLAAAELDLAAYILGGSLDTRMLDLCGLTTTDALFVAAMAVGHD